jgi:RNA polymerase sigma-70 factor (ECF subfamily)
MKAISSTSTERVRTTMPLIQPTAVPLDDEGALVLLAQRDPGQFGALYDRYVRPVYRYLYSRVGTVHDAEDLTAQTFLQALEALPRYRHRGHFAAWLFAIARHKAIDHNRQRRDLLPLEESTPGDEPDPLAQAVQSEQQARLAVLLRELPEDEGELIRLRYTAGLSFSGMAALMGRNEEAVKKALYRLIDRLQDRLEATNE